MGKLVFVASQLLNSMIDVPVPTRAEVADCADAVRQQADALMLSGETAAGMYPVKSVQTLQGVRFHALCGWAVTHHGCANLTGARVTERPSFRLTRLFSIRMDSSHNRTAGCSSTAHE